MRKVKIVHTADALREAIEISMQDELDRIVEMNTGIIYRSLSPDEVNRLAMKINLLPVEHQNILFFRYYFNNIKQIYNILEIENAEAKLIYVEKMLAGFMGIGDVYIDNSSMKEACDLALIENFKEYEGVELLHEPEYSNGFRRRLRPIKIKKSWTKKIGSITKWAAIFVLVPIISLSTILAVNVEARAKFLGWIVETYPEFSTFTPKLEEGDKDNVDMSAFNINYVPEGFQLEETYESRHMIEYTYYTEDDRIMMIRLSNPRTLNVNYDTEGVEIEEFTLKEAEAFTWHTKGMTSLVWYQDGFRGNITGNLSKDEIIKVAEGISK